MPRPAIFLDRDGVLTREKGYITRPADLELLAGAAEGMASLRRAGFPLVVVTNQSAIARGLISETDLEAIHAELARRLAAVDPDARWDAIRFCPHHPSEGHPPYRADCSCRKPKPGMILRAAEALDLDLPSSWMLGDAQRDLAAGRAAGCRTASVPWPDGSHAPGADLQVPDLGTFALTLLRGR